MRKRAIFAVVLMMTLSSDLYGSELLSDQILSVFSEQLSVSGTVFSHDCVRLMSERAEVSEDSIRVTLRSLFEDLEENRANDTVVWKKLIALGADSMTEKDAERVLTLLLTWGEKASTSTGNFPLDVVLKRVAKNSKVPRYLVRNFLLRAVESVAGDSSERRQISVAVGVRIVGASRYLISQRKFQGLRLMDETARFDSSQVADIHLRILTLLVDSLPDLQRVKWVLDRPHPTLVPDFRLTVDVIEFSSTLSIQKLFISAIFEISLESIEDNGKSKSDRLAVVFDTSTMSD